MCYWALLQHFALTSTYSSDRTHEWNLRLQNITKIKNWNDIFKKIFHYRPRRQHPSPTISSQQGSIVTIVTSDTFKSSLLWSQKSISMFWRKKTTTWWDVNLKLKFNLLIFCLSWFLLSLFINMLFLNKTLFKTQWCHWWVSVLLHAIQVGLGWWKGPAECASFLKTSQHPASEFFSWALSIDARSGLALGRC